jgi:hypothetical protein
MKKWIAMCIFSLSLCGPVRSAITFNSVTDDFVSVSSATSLVPSTITIMAWVYGSSWNATNCVITKDNGAAFYTIQVKSTGKLDVGFSSGTTASRYNGTGTYTLSTGTWYHVAAVYSKTGGTTGYVNGLIDASTSTSCGFLSVAGSNATNIGRDPVAANYFTGAIADVRIYNRVLSQQEILSIALSQRPIPITDGQLGWWVLDDHHLGEAFINGQPIVDRSGNGISGVPSGSPSWSNDTWRR